MHYYTPECFKITDEWINKHIKAICFNLFVTEDRNQMNCTILWSKYRVQVCNWKVYHSYGCVDIAKKSWYVYCSSLSVFVPSGLPTSTKLQYAIICIAVGSAVIISFSLDRSPSQMSPILSFKQWGPDRTYKATMVGWIQMLYPTEIRWSHFAEVLLIASTVVHNKVYHSNSLHSTDHHF